MSLKINRNLGLFWKLRNSLNTNSKLLLYYSLIYSHLHYGNAVWGGAAKTHLNHLFVSQKKAVRFISSAHYLAASHPLFKNLGILKLDDINVLTISKFMHQQLNNQQPLINFTAANQIHQYNTRRAQNLRPARHGCHTNKFITYRGCNIWNELPESIKSLTNPNTFKINLKKHLLSRYWYANIMFLAKTKCVYLDVVSNFQSILMTY